MQWKKFLACGENKEKVLFFLKEQWELPEYASQMLGKDVYVTCCDICYKLTSMDGNTVISEMIPELTSSQEEADTRLLLHSQHASLEGHKGMILNIT